MSARGEAEVGRRLCEVARGGAQVMRGEASVAGGGAPVAGGGGPVAGGGVPVVRWAALWGLLLAGGLTAGCERPKGPSAPPGLVSSRLSEADGRQIVAKIGEREISLAEVETRINQQSPFARSRYASLARKRELLESLVRFELLVEAAKAKGYERHPDVILAHKQALVQQLSQHELNDLVKPEEITEAQVAAHYAEHADRFMQPAALRAAQIVLPSEAEAQALLARLKAELEGLDAQLTEAQRAQAAREIFARFAREHSTQPATAALGGDLGWFSAPGQPRWERGPSEPAVPLVVAQAAAALSGEASLAPVAVRGVDAWYLVQRTGTRAAQGRSLDEVRPQIRAQLLRKRRIEATEAYVAALRAQAQVVVNEALLSQLRIEDGPPADRPEVQLAPPTLRPELRAAPEPYIPPAAPASTEKKTP